MKTVSGLVLLVVLLSSSSCMLFFPAGYEKLVEGTSSSVSGAVPREGLIGEWLFNDGTPRETSGQVYSQSAIIGYTTDRFARPAAAAQFSSGMGHYIQVYGASPFDSQNYAQMTVNFWYNTNMASGPVLQLKDASAWPYAAFQIDCYGSSVGVYNSTNGMSIGLSATNAYLSAVPSDWVMVTVIFDVVNSPHLKIYINGILTVTEPYRSLIKPALASIFYLGRNDTAMNYAGGLDDIRFYKRTLNQLEIDLLYREGDWGGGSVSSSPPLPAWSTFGNIPNTSEQVSNVSLKFDENGAPYLMAVGSSQYFWRYNTGNWDNYVTNFYNSSDAVFLPTASYLYLGFENNGKYSFFGSAGSFFSNLTNNFTNVTAQAIARTPTMVYWLYIEGLWVYSVDGGSYVPVQAYNLTSEWAVTVPTGLAACQYSNGGKILFAVATDQGIIIKEGEQTTWNQIALLSFYNRYRLQIASDNMGMVVGHKTTELDTSLVLSWRDSGLTWFDLNLPEGLGGSRGLYALDIYNGQPYVAYLVGPVPYKIKVVRYSGGSWQQVGALFEVGDIYSLSLTVRGGTVYVAFDDLVNFGGKPHVIYQ